MKVSAADRRRIRAAKAYMRAEKKRLTARMNAWIKAADESGQDGWNGPPAQIPHAGEISLGVYYDRNRNTY